MLNFACGWKSQGQYLGELIMWTSLRRGNRCDLSSPKSTAMSERSAYGSMDCMQQFSVLVGQTSTITDIKGQGIAPADDSACLVFQAANPTC